jgi:hypothetical protein
MRRKVVWWMMIGFAVAIGGGIVARTPLGRVETNSGTNVYGAANSGPTSASSVSRSNGIERRVPLFSENWLESIGKPLEIDPDEPDPRDLSRAQAARSERFPRKIRLIEEKTARLSKVTDLETWRVLKTSLARLRLYEGDFARGSADLAEVQATYPETSLVHANYDAALGVAAMRGGEVENCVSCQNEASCVFPLAAAAIHQKKTGSRKAIEYFSKYLKRRPEDVGVRWLLNVAYMTLGEYPDRVPTKWLIKLNAFESKVAVGRFVNVAKRTGVDVLGPKFAGGSVFDDFNDDGLLDVVASTENPVEGASILINQGNGTFIDRSAGSGLEKQTGSLNIKHADFDNDGNLDVLFLRGGWENPQRMSLMRNKGDGTFEDVTVSAGLDRPIASASAGWADYDNDGFVDLYIAGETRSDPPPSAADDADSNPNAARLYHNNGDGTFTDTAEEAGVRNVAFAKGVAWGDYDSDGFPDLFVSNMNARSILYHNERNGTFVDVGMKLGVPGPWTAFACWFWDYDNDGDLDLFVNAYDSNLKQTIASMLGERVESEHPRLYRNDGAEGFRDVTTETGLNRVIMAMGCNYGDIDNDGYLDIYEGTGTPEYSFLIPNVMLKNDRGGRFVDVTLSSGTGHLQKGHGVSFGDWNNDGYSDIFVRSGGASKGDRANAVLFQNPGGNNHWIHVKLIGKKTNRAAIGAAVRLTLPDEPGYPSPNIRYRVVSSGSSWGGNGFPMTIGVGGSTTIKKLEVIWPTSKTTQTFADVAIDQAITISEFADTYVKVDRKRIEVPKLEE